MGDSTSRLFGVLGLAIAVWVVVFWLYEPSSRRRILVDERPIQDAAPPAPALPQPRSLPPVPPPAVPAPAAPVQPPEPEPMPIAGPGEVLIPPEFIDYTVQPGDRSLQDIANRFYGDRSRWMAISRANPFFTPDKLKPGVTVLRIPKDPDNIRGKVVKIDPPRPTPPTPPAAPAASQQPDRSPADPAEPSTLADGWRTYTVQDNDTLWGISKRMYGRSSLTNLIAEANTDVLPDPDRIKAGITLRIPPAPPAD